MAMKDRKSIEEIQENLPLYQNFEQYNQVLEKINVVVSQEVLYVRCADNPYLSSSPFTLFPWYFVICI
jgi:hypothetical protein